jgi:V/A-type H+-transporting ATPase subunit A
VSPAGGNFEEPVTQATLAVVGAFLALSRSRSDARRYPAIDPLISWSKYVEDVSRELDQQVEGWGRHVKHASKILREGDEIGKRMEVVGEEGITLHDMITYLKSELYEFSYLQQNAFDKEDAYCPLSRQVPLFNLVNTVFNASFHFDGHDAARSFFLDLQNEIKNMNFMPFKSERYDTAVVRIQEKIQSAVKGHS